MVMTRGGYEFGTTQAALTDGVRKYYDRQQEDRNLLLAGDSGIVNHHFGIGEIDARRSLDDYSQEDAAAQLARLEMGEIDCLLEHMGEVLPEHRVLDAGCGRGGTSFCLAERSGAQIDGVTISPYQHEFANKMAERLGMAQRVRFHLMNYLDLEFEDDVFDHVFTNESTQYVLDVRELVGGFARVLKPGGRYTAATWCINEDFGDTNDYVKEIDLHYGTSMNRRLDYVEALEQGGFDDVVVDDVTELAIPYWELRCRWQHRSGVELPFLHGHQERKILYLLVSGRLR